MSTTSFIVRCPQLFESRRSIPKAATALRRHVAERYPVITGAKLPKRRKTREQLEAAPSAFASEVAVTDPPHRRVRVYAVDPKDAPLDGGASDEWLIGHAPDERGARELAARHYAGTGSEMFTLHHGVCPETGDDAWFAY